MTVMAGGADASAVPGLAELWNGRWASVTRLALVALASIALYAVVAATTPWGYRFGTAVYYLPYALGVVLSVGPIRRSHGLERTGWLSLAVASATLAIGDAIYSYDRLVFDENAPFPGRADVFAYAGYIALVAAMVLLTFPRWRLKDRRWLVEAAIVMVAAGTLSWQYVMAPMAAATNHSYLDAAVALGYPLFDLCIVTAIVLTFYFSAGPLGPRAFVLGVMGVILCITDSAWSYLVTSGNFSGGGPVWVSIGFLVAHWLMAASFVLPRDASRLALPSLARAPGIGTGLLLPYIAVLVLALAAFFSALRGDAAPVLTGGTVLTMGLTLVGYVVLRRGNLALVRQFQHEHAYRHALVRAAEGLGEASAVVSGGRLVDVNEIACSLLGYRRNQLLTLTGPGSLLAPEGREEAVAAMRAAVTEGMGEGRIRVAAMKRDGQRVTLELAVAPFAVTGGGRFLLLARPAEPAAVSMPPSPFDVPESIVAASGAAHSLSPRELEIVGLIARGYSNQDMADLLEISLKTVEVHALNIRKKLPVHNRVQLVRYALQHGLVDLAGKQKGGARRR